MDLTPTIEQKLIIDASKQYNVIINAVAGSGKTKTSLMLNGNILIITYNAKLKSETREQVKQYGFKNIEVHSYHSFCVKYYDKKCHTDIAMHKIFSKEYGKKFSYDIIVIDEVQDMTMTYYELICKIIKDSLNKPIICACGDSRQRIYDYNGATDVFIDYGDSLFKFNDNEWRYLTLSVSFRLSTQHADFINYCMLGEKVITGTHTGPKPKYIMCDTFNQNETYDILKRYLNMGYKNEDIFVLAPSVKSDKSPVKILSNKLSEKGYDIYIPLTDEEHVDDAVLKGKIVFMTFHQSKGLERKVVIVYNFDDSYMTYYGKGLSVDKCPNTLYVAATRSTEHMTILHHYKSNFLPFLNKLLLREYCEYEERCRAFENNASVEKTTISVTELIKYNSTEIIIDCLKLLEIVKIKKSKNKLSIALTIAQNNLHENVADITGTAIPIYFELKNTDTLTILDRLREYSTKLEKKDISRFEIKLYHENFKYLKTHRGQLLAIDRQKLSIKELLYLANLWNSYQNKVIYKMRQITNYDWIGQDILDKCIKRLNKNIANASHFEQFFFAEVTSFSNKSRKYVYGYIDVIDGNNIYELKCVKELKADHYLQLALYMFLLESEKKRIFNKINDMSEPFNINGDYRRLEKDQMSYGLNESVYMIAMGEIILIKEETDEYLGVLYVDKIVRIIKKDMNVMHKITYLGDCKYYLMNILTSELMEVRATYTNLEYIAKKLIKNKYDINTGDKVDINLYKSIKIYSKYKTMDKIKYDIKDTTYGVIDIETTGLGKCLIVQIAINIYGENMELLGKHNMIIDNGLGQVDYFKKFTCEHIIKFGKPLKEVLTKVIAIISKVKYVVGHNAINFDMRLIREKCTECDVIYECPEIIDTMVISNHLVCAKTINGRSKYPKLSELYMWCTGKEMDTEKAHGAEYDVEITATCFKKMAELKLF